MYFFSADQKKKAQTDKLQEEIDKLKDQLQLTRSQLEAEQHAHMVKLAKVGHVLCPCSATTVCTMIA